MILTRNDVYLGIGMLIIAIVIGMLIGSTWL